MNEDAELAAGCFCGNCPECAAGKHKNCNGQTWDNATDSHVECPCSRGGHA